MPWAPGQSGNPNGYKGPRERRRAEVFDIIKNLGHKDALETLSYLQHNEQIDPGLRIAAAAALAPYCHPKMQATPTPRFIDLQLDIPEFSHVSDAENFLAKIALLTAKGHLDIQSAQELSGLVKTWIDSQYLREELNYKISPPETRDTTIRIEGGLPALPGTNVTMPVLDGKPVTNGHAALAAPVDACRGLKLLPRPRTLNLHHRTPSYEPRRYVQAHTCLVGPTDSRYPSHALLAYDGNMVAYAKLRSFAY
jgi:hypothetical protein